MKQSILITGANGLLGQHLVKFCLKRNLQFFAASKGANRNDDCPDENYFSLDITNEISVLHILNQLNPTHIINTAAMTNVDMCESLTEECQMLNVTAVSTLFDWCKVNNTHFQQLSTDFIFKGTSKLYKEEDTPEPLSTYGQSKLSAEKLLTSSEYTNWSIVRTIVVYGTANNLSRSNIVLWGREQLLKGNTIQIVDDQFRAPTWVEDLAWACLQIIEQDQKGIFHISGPSAISMFDFVSRMAKHYGVDESLVQSTTTAKLGQLAKRPPITGFDLSKANKLINYHPTSIEDSLALLERYLSS